MDRMSSLPTSPVTIDASTRDGYAEALDSLIRSGLTRDAAKAVMLGHMGGMSPKKLAEKVTPRSDFWHVTSQVQIRDEALAECRRLAPDWLQASATDCTRLGPGKVSATVRRRDFLHKDSWHRFLHDEIVTLMESTDTVSPLRPDGLDAWLTAQGWSFISEPLPHGVRVVGSVASDHIAAWRALYEWVFPRLAVGAVIEVTLTNRYTGEVERGSIGWSGDL